MTEYTYEQLEKLLPNGFFVVYVSNDGQYRYSASNPNHDQEIADMIQLFLDSELE